ncbi:hypothetical protein FSP39_008951 [Pinctada imbricata]|uniref:FAS1 domain-containing protein n=1 Tax=Pinctada imbricata TaxID=66713 RepID=A0AA88YM50_PINIB|nr:hypothetical protein FSP39_008951 [Pinctada imbricata]
MNQFAAAFLLIGFVSVNAQIDKRNVLQYLEDGNFTTLVNLVKRVGLAAPLSTGIVVCINPYYIFAPTDEAFNKLPVDVLLKLRADPSSVLGFLQFHVVGGIAINNMFTNGSTFDTLNNKTIHIIKYKNNATVANGVPISQNEVIVRNGVIHKVDRVLLPLEKSISEYLGEHDIQFQDLYAALVLEGYEKALEGGNFTLFAPEDHAFSSIIAALPTITADDNLFKKILAMHVVPGVYFSAALTDGMKLTTLAGNQLTVSINSKVFIDGAQVIVTDVATTNGAIHTITSVITPPSST